MSDSSSIDTVLAERREQVLLLTLNRPDRLNAWSDELNERYFERLDEAEADPEVRAIVVTGAGRGFCAGADMDQLNDVAGGEKGSFEAATSRPRSFPLSVRKPLIAAINGPAAGLGLVEALYCDLRFCTPEAKLTTAFARRGLIAEYGISWLLPRITGLSNALDLLMSGRVVLGEEALRMGLVDRLSPRESVVDDAIAYAAELAAYSSPSSMATMKAQVFRDLDRSFEESFADSDRLMLESFDGADIQEGVDSYLEKRPPVFRGLPSRP